MYSKPIISVITICYNNIAGLQKSVESVRTQEIDLEKIEHIIIDGNSNDGTKEYLKTLKINGFYVCENDSGIFDAMNKGIKLSKGKYLHFLNSGDIYYNKNCLKNLAKLCEEKNGIISGVSLFSIDQKYFYEINFKPYYNHQSVLIPRELNLTNLYDTDLKILGDLEFWIRIKKKGYNNFIQTDLKFVKMILDGVGSSPKTRLLRIKDKVTIIKKHPSAIREYISLIKQTLILIYEKLIRLY